MDIYMDIYMQMYETKISTSTNRLLREIPSLVFEPYISLSRSLPFVLLQQLNSRKSEKERKLKKKRPIIKEKERKVLFSGEKRNKQTPKTRKIPRERRDKGKKRGRKEEKGRREERRKKRKRREDAENEKSSSPSFFFHGVIKKIFLRGVSLLFFSFLFSSLLFFRDLF